MKALKIVGAVIALIAAGIVIVLMTVDVGRFKGMIESQARAATGRQVTIGDIDLSISLAPAIVLTDVKVANAAWGSRAEMAVLPRIAVHTQLIPLLFGTYTITDIAAENPDVLLEVDKSGRGNWEFDVPSGGGSAPLNVGGVTVSGLKVGYRDARDTVAADIAVKTLKVVLDGALQDMNVTALETQDAALSWRTAGEPLTAAIDSFTIDRVGKIAVKGKVAGDELKVTGTLAPVAVLAARNTPFPVKVEMEGFGVKVVSDVSVEMLKGRPFAKGTIAVAEVDLAKFGSRAAAKGNERAFSDDALPWSSLNGADADLSVTISKLTTAGGVAVTDISLPLKLAGGRLTASPVSLTVGGGTVGGTVALGASDKSVAITVEGKGFSAETLAKMLNKGDLVSQGPIAATLAVRGAGDSVRDVMASLDGSMIATMGESRIRNDALGVPGAGAILQVLNLANPFANKDPYMLARCGVVNFQISDGVAYTAQGIAMVTDKMSLTSSGQVDLRSERIDLNVRTQGASGIAGGIGQLAQAVKVTGTLSAPSVGIDQTGVVKSVAGLGSALAKGGGKGLGGIGALFGLGPKTGSAAAGEGAGGDLCARARAWRRS